MREAVSRPPPPPPPPPPRANNTHVHKVGVDVVAALPFSVQAGGEFDSAVVVWEDTQEWSGG